MAAIVRADRAMARPKRAFTMADLPRSIADSFRQCQLSVMDYYRMKNVQADTAMRDAIAGTGDEPSPRPPRRGEPQ